MAGKRPIQATAIPENTAKSLYPEPFATLVKHRTKRKLGDHFGLANFGVNLTTLAPGAISALKHHHGRQDEFVYVLSGTPTLRHGEEEYQMSPGECIGFKGGSGLAHQLLNHGEVDAVYLEVGDRLPGDTVEYPDDDLALVQGADGAWSARHKDGSPY
ncbi:MULTISPECIES: cupin domain-containing protein [Aeromonas]|uniref:cupin domain-containing protein n=1 Tax=Aeromonas TaxID=642 RepID=UPI0029D521DC|nr:cupin domain-containing protein [Aeromonas caviae]MDX7712776.1 cupin domain-containing protein [Aeromonas caviae]MEB6642227.1 cupin domain-containing protein [Aeromonas caviae]